MTADMVLEDIQKFGGTLIKTNLCHENDAKLRDALASTGFATQCRWGGVKFVSRENAGNECAGASARMAAAWADSFPAPSDTPHRTAAAKDRFHCKAASTRKAVGVRAAMAS
jgi:hypothetical protein